MNNYTQKLPKVTGGYVHPYISRILTSLTYQSIFNRLSISSLTTFYKLKNKIILLPLVFAFTSIAYAQTGINTRTPDENSVLDIVSDSKGVLLPRLNNTQVGSLANIAGLPEGMLVYNTDEDCLQIYTGTDFECLVVGSQADPTKDAWVDDNTNAMVKLGTQSNGSTVRTEGTEVVIKDNGKVGIGLTNPAEKLSVKGGNIRLEHTAPDIILNSTDNTQGSRFLFQENGLNLGTLQVIGRNNSEAIRRGNMEFYSATRGNDITFHTTSTITTTSPPTATVHERMRITKQEGYIGIGTPAPQKKLHVAGQVKADSTVTAPNYVTTVQTISGTWDMTKGANASWNLSNGNNTLTIDNAKAGMSGLIKLTNAGSSTVALPTGSKVVNGGNGTVELTKMNEAVDILTFYYDGTNYWWTYGNNYN